MHTRRGLALSRLQVRLLTCDPVRRPTAEALLSHPFFSGATSYECMPPPTPPAPSAGACHGSPACPEPSPAALDTLLAHPDIARYILWGGLPTTGAGQPESDDDTASLRDVDMAEGAASGVVTVLQTPPAAAAASRHPDVASVWGRAAELFSPASTSRNAKHGRAREACAPSHLLGGSGASVASDSDAEGLEQRDPPASAACKLALGDDSEMRAQLRLPAWSAGAAAADAM